MSVSIENIARGQAMMDPKINFFAANRFSALRGNGRALLMTGALIAFSAAGCGEAEQVAPPTPYDFEIAVMAVDSAENPVSKAPVILDGNLVGYTDQDGIYGATLTEFVGTEVTVSIGDMEAYFVSETRSEEHTSELQSRPHLVCRLLLEKKNNVSALLSHIVLVDYV